MTKRAILFVAPLASILALALPDSPVAHDSPFLLQDHGTVRVLRGLNPEQNFQTATLPQDVDLAPAAAPPAESAPPQIEPPRPSAEPGLTTRERALRRVGERGIRVIQAGVRYERGANFGQTRRQAVERARQRSPVNRAGG
ncbi:MAG: hypothetical protein R3285_03250 [Kiloniellales bacterium]|nr:hypothetical protein [Kiloniellales bacterium]